MKVIPKAIYKSCLVPELEEIFFEEDGKEIITFIIHPFDNFNKEQSLIILEETSKKLKLDNPLSVEDYNKRFQIKFKVEKEEYKNIMNRIVDNFSKKI